MRWRLDIQKHLLGAGVINGGEGLGEGTGGRSRDPRMQQAGPCASGSGNPGPSLEAEAFVFQLLALQCQSPVAPAPSPALWL